MLTYSICPDFLSGKAPIAFDFPRSSTRQWNYLTHSWDLGIRACPYADEPWTYRASGDLDSSETLWFCLGQQCTQLPSTTSKRIPSLGHIGLTVWEAITEREDLRTRLPFHSKLLSYGEAESESDKPRHYNTHTVRITQSFGRQELKISTLKKKELNISIINISYKQCQCRNTYN